MQAEALTKTIKKMVLDMKTVDVIKESTVQELRNLVCDAWLYGMKDGTKLTDEQHERMQAYINETAKQMKRVGRVA